MILRKIFALALLAGIGCSAEEKKDDKVNDRSKPGKTVVEFDSLKASPPADWVEETPKQAPGGFGSLRAYQFKVPRVGDDSADGEVIVFTGIKGSAAQNLDRWKGQFLPPEGKKIEDVAKVEELKVAGCPVSVLDVRGTFQGPPMGAPTGGGKKPGWRMIGVHFEAPRSIYHVIFRGPEATVTKYKPGFDEWLKSFK